MHLASRHKMLERRVYDVVLPWRRPNIYFFAKLFHAKKISVTKSLLHKLHLKLLSNQQSPNLLF